MSFLRWLTLAGLLAAVTLGLPNIAPGFAQNKPRVVATFSIVGEVVRHVGGDRIDLVTLVGPDGDSERYEPVPSDANAIASASLIFENGLGSEPWLDRLYAGARASALRVQTSTGVELIKGTEAGEQGFDPHVWQAVPNVIQMTYNVRDALSTLDPPNAGVYAQNADAYVTRLQRLQDWVLAQVNQLPPEQRKLVTSHDTFGYFARAYGFEIVGVGLESFFTDAQPSATQVARLVNQIRAARVPVVFVENVTDPRLMETVAREARVTVGPPLYTDALGAPGSSGDSYISMMTHNVSAIVNALAS